MMTTMIALTAMVLSACLLSVEGSAKCILKSKGKLLQFNEKKVKVNIPCKFHATTFFCEGYRIHVAPGLSLDKKMRYYTTSAWIRIWKEGTDFTWAGRTSDMRLARIANGTNIPAFRMKQENMDGAPFKVKMEKFPADQTVSLRVSDAKWKIFFNGYDPDDKTIRKRNGIKILCKEPTFDPLYDYPVSVCGNGTDANAIGKAKKEYDLPDRTIAVVYNVLEYMPKVAQSSDLCRSAGTVFEKCDNDRSDAVMTCAPLLTNNQLLRYMRRFNLEPMQEFLSCMKYKCNNDINSCDLVMDHMAAATGFSLTCSRVK